MGTPDQCIEKLGRLREAMGINHFNASFWFGDLKQEQILRSMDLFANEVMPEFRPGGGSYKPVADTTLAQSA
ncbi:MAG: hypothetical protein AAGD43_25605, partial [Pseudomonadota bacterium]